MRSPHKLRLLKFFPKKIEERKFASLTMVGAVSHIHKVNLSGGKGGMASATETGSGINQAMALGKSETSVSLNAPHIPEIYEEPPSVEVQMFKFRGSQSPSVLLC
jgi:hypothetical protein